MLDSTLWKESKKSWPRIPRALSVQKEVDLKRA